MKSRSSRLLTTLALTLLVAIAAVTPCRAQPKSPGGIPRPVAVWPTGPLVVVAAFDRPVDPKWMLGRIVLYSDPMARSPESAGQLRIVGVQPRDDSRTLLLATDPHPRQARYQLPIPQPNAVPDARSGGTISYDLSGLEATWTEGEQPGSEPNWTGWWPVLNLAETRRLTAGSRPHQVGWDLMNRKGRLGWAGWVSLPAGKVTVRLRSSMPIEETTLGDVQSAGTAPAADSLFLAEMVVDSRGEPIFFTAAVRTGSVGQTTQIAASYRLEDGPGDRPIEREQWKLPWAPVSSASTPSEAAPIAVPDLSGGDPVRGREIFRGDRGRCAYCHVFRGEGGHVGPDLTPIVSKGRAELYRSIAAPSAVIAADFTTYTVATRDGQVFAGVVRAEGSEAIRVTDTNAKATTVRREAIQEIRPSATSIMPPGLVAAIGQSGVRDLLAYLTSPTPSPLK